MSEIIEIVKTEDFNEQIKTGVTLVDFWANWCGPCKMQGPVLEEFNAEMGDKIKVAKVDVDKNEKLCYQYGIMSIPFLAVFSNGELVNKAVGLTSKDGLKKLVEKYL